MNLHRTAIAAALAAVVLLPCAALGAGYGIYEQGASALGMAGAGTASVHDASAVFFNPAAMTRLDGKQVYFGDTWLMTNISFAGVAPYPGFGVTESMKNGNFFPPTFYFTDHFKDRWKNWAFGAGVNAPFGLGVDWKNPDQFSGRERVTKADVRTINGNLSLAYAPNETWSVGVGYDALFAGVELHSVQEAVVPGGGGGKVNVAHIELKSSYQPGYTWNAGAQWTPLPAWKFGLNYRARSHVNITDGDATISQIFTGDTVGFDQAVTAGLPKNQKVTSQLKFPSILSFGAAWNPAPDWTWEVDANRTTWSFFDQLQVGFKDNSAFNQTITENYRDSWRVNVGAEHRLPRFTYRFGYYFDQAAAPVESVTPLLPDANRHGATVGLGCKLGKAKAWTIDAFEMALFVEDRSTDGRNRDGFDGTYKSYVNAAGVNLGYHW